MKVQVGEHIVSLHSFVDVITNSSTTIYIVPVADQIISTLEFMGNSILEGLNLSGKFDEYFKISVVLPEYGYSESVDGYIREFVQQDSKSMVVLTDDDEYYLSEETYNRIVREYAWRPASDIMPFISSLDAEDNGYFLSQIKFEITFINTNIAIEMKGIFDKMFGYVEVG